MSGTWSLKAKMMLAFCTLSLVLLAVGGVGIYSLRQVINDYDHISDVNLASAQYLGRMRYRTQDMNRTLLRIALDPTRASYAHHKSEFDESLKAFNEQDQKYLALPFGPGEKELYEDFKHKWDAYLSAAKRATELASKHDPASEAEFSKTVLGELPALRKSFDEPLSRLADYQEEQAVIWQGKAKEAASLANWWSGSLTLGGFLAAFLVGWFFSTSLANALGRITSEIRQAAELTSAGGSQLSASSQQLSGSATQAASSLEETVASLEELSGMVNRNSEHAAEANNLSQRSRETAEHGEKEIARLIESMSEIAQGSKKIEEIINVIDDIAFQTNLLALNAAVEAARAGEQGKGFAVVAEAVRNLAQRSSSAAKDINVLIRENVDKSDRGAQVAGASATALREIVQSVLKVSGLNNEIATASHEQSQGIAQISNAMNQLDQATQSNAAASEEVAASAEEMSSQAASLNHLVAELSGLVHGDGAKSENHGHHAPTKGALGSSNEIAFVNAA